MTKAIKNTIDMKIDKRDIIDILFHEKRSALERKLAQAKQEVVSFTRDSLTKHIETLESFFGKDEVVMVAGLSDTITTVYDMFTDGVTVKSHPNIFLRVHLTGQEISERDRRLESSQQLERELRNFASKEKAIRAEMLKSIVESSEEGAKVLASIRKVAVALPSSANVEAPLQEEKVHE
jgi:preprotein translocase subunit YajC